MEIFQTKHDRPIRESVRSSQPSRVGEILPGTFFKMNSIEVNIALGIIRFKHNHKMFRICRLKSTKYNYSNFILQKEKEKDMNNNQWETLRNIKNVYKYVSLNFNILEDINVQKFFIEYL